MSEIVTVTFNGVTAEIKPAQDGMYDLNDIWRTFKLPSSKQPHQWRHRDRRELEVRAELRLLKAQKGRQNQLSLATKKALFVYAAWCNFEFHDAVFSVFQLVTKPLLT